MFNKTGPKTDPCGSLNFIEISTDSYSLTQTFWHLQAMKPI